MTEKNLTLEEIAAIVDGFDPIDRVQMEILAKLPPGQRIAPMINATLMVRAGLRSAFIRKKLKKETHQASGKSVQEVYLLTKP